MKIIISTGLQTSVTASEELVMPSGTTTKKVALLLTSQFQSTKLKFKSVHSYGEQALQVLDKSGKELLVVPFDTDNSHLQSCLYGLSKALAKLGAVLYIKEVGAVKLGEKDFRVKLETTL